MRDGGWACTYRRRIVNSGAVVRMNEKKMGESERRGE
jgi:hypothetical protein